MIANIRFYSPLSGFTGGSHGEVIFSETGQSRILTTDTCQHILWDGPEFHFSRKYLILLCEVDFDSQVSCEKGFIISKAMALYSFFLLGAVSFLSCMPMGKWNLPAYEFSCCIEDGIHLQRTFTIPYFPGLFWLEENTE